QGSGGVKSGATRKGEGVKMDNEEKTTCERCGCDHSSDRARWVIAATIRDGEPRYIATTLDGRAFDYLKIVRGYEVVTDWDGRMGTLLVPRDEEEEHDARRRKLGNITLTEIREGKGGIIANIMADVDLMKRTQ